MYVEDSLYAERDSKCFIYYFSISKKPFCYKIKHRKSNKTDNELL